MLSRTKPWMFGLTILPYGMIAAFCHTLMGHKLAAAGVSLKNIGWNTILTGIPVFAQFLYTPLFDLVLNKRIWLFIGALMSALCVISSVFVDLPSGLNLYLVLIFMAQFGATIVSSCNAGLMATLLPKEVQHKAAGWYSLGNIGGTGILIGIMTILIQYTSPTILSVIYGLLAIGPGIFALFIPHSTLQPDHTTASTAANTPKMSWSGSISSLYKALKTHAGWTGILICLAPVGTAALAVNGFSSLSEKYYHMTPLIFSLSHGFISGISSSIGALISSNLNHQFSRRKLYIVAGVISAGVCFFLTVLPFTPISYAVGVGMYSLVTGFANSAFYGFVLDIIRKDKVPVSTYFTLFTSVANISIGYVVIINSYAGNHYGPHGMFISNALLTLLGAVILLMLSRIFISNKSQENSVDEPTILIPKGGLHG